MSRIGNQKLWTQVGLKRIWSFFRPHWALLLDKIALEQKTNAIARKHSKNHTQQHQKDVTAGTASVP